MNGNSLPELALVLVIGCGVPLLVSAATALVIGILQAATQVQEQTTLFLARLTSLTVTLWFISPWLGRRLVAIFVDVLRAFGRPSIQG